MPINLLAPIGSIANTSIENLIQFVIALLFVTGIVFSIAFLIYGGIRWILSGGDKAKVEAARGHIVASIVGLVIIAAAFLIFAIVFQLLGARNPLTEGLCIPTLQHPFCQPKSTPTPIPQQPAPNTAQGLVSINLSVFLEGIGPARANLTQKVFVASASAWTQDNNQETAIKGGTITYDAKTGMFRGTLDSGSPLVAQNYYFKVKVNRFLKKQILNVFVVKPDPTPKTIQLSTLLLGGDANNNGKIDMEDYGIIVRCFGKKQNSKTCLDKKGDLNYDGIINEIDYNMVVRNFGKTDE